VRGSVSPCCVDERWADVPASSPLYYLTSLTGLLESIAHIIDQHQPVVDKYYGKGRMRTVVGRLVGEGDRVVRSLIEGWEEERRVGRLVSVLWAQDS
jgi:hypothetical protein